MGLCADISYVPVDKIQFRPKPEEGWRRKSGAAETLTSHAGDDYLDIVQSIEILLHFCQFPRGLAMPPSALFDYFIG